MKKRVIGCLLALALAVSVGAVSLCAAAEAAVDTISFGELQNKTAAAGFGLSDGAVVKYGAKTGLIKDGSLDGVVDFDTAAENVLTLTADKDLKFENWQWFVTKNNAVILVFEAKIKCVLSVSSNLAAGAAPGGWIADTLISVYTEKDGALTKQSENATSAESVNVSRQLEAGETLYYMFSAPTLDGGSRNIQNVHTYSATATEVSEGDTYLTAAEYKAELINYIAALNESDYSTENWAVIAGAPALFESAATGKEGAELLIIYNSHKAMIDAVKTVAGELADEKASLKSSFNAKIDGDGTRDGVVESDFINASDYETVIALKTEFAAAVDSCESIAAAREKFAEYTEKLNAYSVKATTVDFLYGLVEDTVEAGYGLYKKFGLVEYGLKWGFADRDEINDFDAHSFTSSEKALYVKSLGRGDVSAQNWQWLATKKGGGVIAAFKTLKDSSLEFVCTRLADGDEIGWTVNTTLKVYLYRESVGTKAVYTVNTPSTDAQFGGKFYAKAGDIIYYEFTTDHMTDTVNIQTPFATKVRIDSEGFDAAAYDEQNNDVPKEVSDAVASYYTQLTEFAASLKESDYSATNWSQITVYPGEFLKAAEQQLGSDSTVADVKALYDTYYNYIDSLNTLSEDAAEFEALKTSKKQEIRDYADEMLSKNKYSKENKELIESYVSAAITSIDAAATAQAVNTAVTTAKNQIKNVEVKKGGCGSAAAAGSASALAVLASLAAVLLIKRKKKA